MYGSLSEANTYFSTYNPSAGWSDYSSAQRTAALNRATLLIDRLPYTGKKYDYTQTLQFPRYYYDGIESIYFDVNTSGTVIVPVDVEYATYEQALFLLDSQDNEVIAAMKMGITSITTAATSESYDWSKLPFDPDTQICREAMFMLQPYLLRGC